MSQASADAVLLLDDDAALLEPAGLERALGILSRDGDVAAVAFAQANADGRPWAETMQPARGQTPRYVAAFIGFAHLLRRDVFLRVTLPLSMPGVVAGTLLTFIPAAGDFINAELLGTPNQFMIGNVIQSRYLEVADYPTAAALSFLLMAFMLIIVVIWARIAGTEALLGTEGERR